MVVFARMRPTVARRRLNLGVKGMVARLLAAEHLTIEYRPVRTASFDVQRRILTLPCLDVSDTICDMFVAHETGHALFTPEEWGEVGKLVDPKREGLAKKYANVVEDSRIERMIKHKYPGLRVTFEQAYAELRALGLLQVRPDTHLIDRINIFFKAGPSAGVAFTSQELPLVEMVANCESFDDVVAAAKRLLELASDPPKDHEEEQEEPSKPAGDAQQGASTEDDSEPKEDPSEPQEDPSEGQPGDEEGDQEDDGDDDGDDDPEEQPSEGPDGGEEEDKATTEAPAPESQQALDEHFERVAATQGPNLQYLTIPTVNLGIVVTDFLQVHAGLHIALESQLGRAEQDWVQFQRRNRDTVTFVYQRFELKKRAAERRKTRTAPTGVIDPTLLYSYRFNEDIFRRKTITPTGQNHGLVIYVDWSQSMLESMRGVIEQLLCICLFCRKARIPFEVFAINVRDIPRGKKMKSDPFSRADGQLWMSPTLTLRVLLSSRMSTQGFKLACLHLLAMFQGNQMRHRTLLPADRLGGATPLDEAVVCAYQQVAGFRDAYRLDIVNVVFLTDSAGTTGGAFVLNGKQTTMDPKKSRFVLRDLVTHIDYPLRDAIKDGKNIHACAASTLRQALMDRHGVNLIGFFVTPDIDDVQRVLETVMSKPDRAALGGDDILIAALEEQGCLRLEAPGYTEFYILMGGSKLSTEAEETGHTLVDRCISYGSSKLRKKIVLTRFVDLIA